MKASELKKALDSNVKRASQTTINQIKNKINKQNKVNKMPAQKEEKEHKAPTFDGLREIVDLKKQKAIANELDNVIFEQEQLKTKRISGTQPQQEVRRTPSPLEVWIAGNPEKLKDMTMEDVAKMSMFTNQSGGSDPMSMLMAMTMNKKNSNGGENELTNTILKVLIEKMFGEKGGNGKAESNENMMFKYMMEQNSQNQKLMLALIEKQNAPHPENQNQYQSLLKEIFIMQKDKDNFENTFLKDKLRELEVRTQGGDSLGEAKRVIDYFQTFQPLFSGQNATPAGMEHEIKLKELNFEQSKQVNEEARRSASMAQIGDMINNTIETFGKVLSEPIAEAAKSKIEQFTEHAKNPTENVQRVRISPEQYQQEIDLGDLDALQSDLELHEKPQTPKGKSSRFKVSESGH